MSFPDIKGIRWLSESIPDLIAIPITLEDRRLKELLDLPDMEIPNVKTDQYIDLSKLITIRPFYPIDSEEESEEECHIDLGGDSHVIELPRKSMLDAWLVYKHYEHYKYNK